MPLFAGLPDWMTRPVLASLGDDDECGYCPDIMDGAPSVLPRYCGREAAYWVTSNINGGVFAACVEHAAWVRTQPYVLSISNQPPS